MKPKIKMRSMFDPPESESGTLETSTQQEKSEPPKIKDACPHCGGRSLKTVRSFEHNGHTHYCATICLSDDKMDAFYFTPKEESFAEQAQKEEAKEIVASEPIAKIMEDFAKLKPEIAANYETGEVLKLAQEQVREAFDEAERVIRETPEIAEMNSVLEQAEAATTIIGATNLFGDPIEKEQKGALAERFGVPPFSVLDARQGYWKDRKAEWLAMGISSADGRDDVPFEGDVKDFDYLRKRELQRGIKGVVSQMSAGMSEDIRERFEQCGVGASIFDPVLCELAYKWFAPPGGKILDPFAGGSVRGIVAEKLGYKYTGIELRPEQIAANEKQAAAIGVAPHWIEGDSFKIDELLPMPNEAMQYDQLYDMIFACPPYYDLEQYSESNEDGSAKQTYKEFIVWYEEIFRKCVQRLKWNRFVCVVVGEIRDEEGFYRNFVGDTVSVLLRCGLRYYNEAILVTSIGSLPLRVNAQFGGYRKLGKTHQNLICMYNGNNCDQIAEKFGKVL